MVDVGEQKKFHLKKFRYVKLQRC